MIITERMRSLAKKTIAIIAIHTVLFFLCSYAHEKIDIVYSLSINMQILLLFSLVPLLASFFLTTQFARQGAVVLLGLLPATLLHNIITRFTALPPLTPQIPAPIWKILYEGSFGLLLLAEVFGVWFTFKLLREIHKQIETQGDSTPHL